MLQFEHDSLSLLHRRVAPGGKRGRGGSDSSIKLYVCIVDQEGEEK